MKVFFIFNPLSGMGQIKNNLLAIIDTFSKADYDLTVRATQCRGDAEKTIRKKARSYDLIVCSGGDGTLNEVVNGMMAIKERPLLGYIPSGSTNDYATSLKLPRKMPLSAELIVQGESAALDIGTFNDKYFVYVAAFGAFTQVSYETPQQTKNLIGHLAYVLEGLKSVANIREYEIGIETDGFHHTDKYIYGMVTNSLSVGGLYSLSSNDVSLSDGLFEVMLIKTPKSALELSSITSYLLGIDKSSPSIVTFKTKKIVFHMTELIPWTIDGEYGGMPETVEIEVIKEAINIIHEMKK